MTYRKTVIATLAILAVLSVSTHPATAQLKKVKVDTEVLFETDAVHAGDTLRLAYSVDIEHPYHVQSDKPFPRRFRNERIPHLCGIRRKDTTHALNLPSV